MKKIIILLCIAVSSLCASAQTSHQFSINGGGGLSTFDYKLHEAEGKLSYGFGGDFGVGYTLLFIDMVGIHVGAGLGIYNAKAKLVDGVTIITPGLTDSKGNRFDLHSKLSNYTETQNAMVLNIPIMAQFQILKFYALGGIKIGIPLNVKYYASDVTITNTGYYPNYDNRITSQEFADFGTFTNRYSEGKLKLGVSTMLSLEAGLRFGKRTSFSIGAYFDYGLNNILKDNNQPFISYTNSNPAEFTTNSVLPSLTEKINFMAAGLKVRLAF
ncbi:MAG: outer membrane beta-barrel protein [Bacteroidetes bacterium]|nr:outer membrane beta-barrel protein [Bacteroidota bacterium]MCL2302336.1 outer membrane beta-barrel protein [Lentimicrobiaceae bacterium]